MRLRDGYDGVRFLRALLGEGEREDTELESDLPRRSLRIGGGLRSPPRAMSLLGGVTDLPRPVPRRGGDEDLALPVVRRGGERDRLGEN